MANFLEHIQQAKSNLVFLQKVCQIPEYWDWKVTICFYTAVHLINAHLANKCNLHYRNHGEVDNAINPFIPVSVSKLSEQNYLAYNKLQALSRRSRYLIHDDVSNKSDNLHFTYDKHFAKAIKNLEIVLQFVKNEYQIDFQKTDISCIELKNKTFNFFSII